jgi:hypothetical protein
MEKSPATATIIKEKTASVTIISTKVNPRAEPRLNLFWHLIGSINDNL